jgi:bifunctional non-homologous end joining protein LigD
MRSQAPKPRLPFLEFQMPELVSKAPPGHDWVHEIKYDGFRTELVLEDSRARAYTRRGYDWTNRYPSLFKAVEKLPAKSAILDGEAVVPGITGARTFRRWSVNSASDPTE